MTRPEELAEAEVAEAEEEEGGGSNRHRQPPRIQRKRTRVIIGGGGGCGGGRSRSWWGCRRDATAAACALVLVSTTTSCTAGLGQATAFQHGGGGACGQHGTSSSPSPLPFAAAASGAFVGGRKRRVTTTTTTTYQLPWPQHMLSSPPSDSGSLFAGGAGANNNNNNRQNVFLPPTCRRGESQRHSGGVRLSSSSTTGRPPSNFNRGRFDRPWRDDDDNADRRGNGSDDNNGGVGATNNNEQDDIQFQIQPLPSGNTNNNPLEELMPMDGIPEVLRWDTASAAAAASLTDPTSPGVGGGGSPRGGRRGRRKGMDPSATTTKTTTRRQEDDEQQFFLPYLFTKEQLVKLKVMELKDACRERGLKMTGNKAELQNRLLNWVTDQRGGGGSGVEQISSSAGGGGQRKKKKDPLEDVLEYHRQIKEKKSELRKKRQEALLDQTKTGGAGGIDSSSTSTTASSSSAPAPEPVTDKNGVAGSHGLTQQDGVGDTSTTLGPIQGIGIPDETIYGKHGEGGLGGAGRRTRSQSSDIFRDTATADVDDDEDDEDDDDDDDPPSLLTGRSARDYVQTLNRSFHSPRTATYSNLEVQRMYRDSKHADQNGDRRKAKSLLLLLRDATPADGRVLRRLARMAVEDGRADEARRILQDGARSNPENAHLWHGLAQLEFDHGKNLDLAREYYKRSILADETLPNSYHAWGRLEQSEGKVRDAAALFRRGLRMAPKNHRLWHALGGLYREAGMLPEATHALEKGMQFGPPWSRPFFLTGLAYVAYESGDLSLTRERLRQAVDANGGRHAQGWLALAQLEESEGRLLDARRVYQEATETYEKSRNLVGGMSSRPVAGTGDGSAVCENDTTAASSNRPKDRKSKGKGGRHKGAPANGVVVPRRPGDKWDSVYLSWARMEETHESYILANLVYARAAEIFPNDWPVFVNWAKLQFLRGDLRKGRVLYEVACQRAGTRHADPYRTYAESEMKIGQLELAREVFLSGAEAVSHSSDGQERGLAPLLHSWAQCEWRLGHLDRAASLFDHALRLTNDVGGTAQDRVEVLSTMARFESSPGRSNYRRAQHYICLALKDNPTGRSAVENWKLWADIARLLEDHDLERQCRRQVETMTSEGAGHEIDALLVRGPLLKKYLSRAPWYKKLFPVHKQSRMVGLGETRD